MERFRNKVAVVTGGANGIGRACCLRFSSEGASVVVADRDSSRGAAVVDEIIESGGRAAFAPLDATSRLDAFMAMIPLGRRGQPEDIAATAAFLCSDDAAYFTGEILHPSGGFFTG